MIEISDSTLNRILNTPLKSDGYKIQVAADGYSIGSVQSGMNDREAYAQIFAAGPAFVKAVQEALPWIEAAGIADSDPEQYLNLKRALGAALGRDLESDPEITYEVLGYGTEGDYQDRNYTLIADGLFYKDEALDIGREQLAVYAVVKVQSNDREYLETLRPSR